MPHRIITKLRALEAMDFPSQASTEQPYLTKANIEVLPEEAFDLIDGIIGDCCRIFGTRARPTQTQLRIMSENGYEMTFDGPTVGVCWHATVIHTSKGLIEFR